MKAILLGKGTVVAEYPSGNKYTFDGDLCLIEVENSTAPAVVSPKKIHVLNPLAIVKIGEQIVYHPRAYLASLDNDSVKWLSENKDYAPLGSLENSEAPGAWPKGTRIRKRVYEKDDSHQIGALGTVVGSFMLDDGRYFYGICWDDMSEIAIHCLGYKIEKVYP